MTVPTVAALVKRLEDAQAAMLPGQKSMDKLTLHYLANLTVAAELKDGYQQLEDGIADIDVLKAAGSKLDAIVSHVLIEGRMLGDYATGTAVFKTAYPATSIITIPAGTKTYAILEDGTKLYFQTTEAGRVLAGNSQVAITSRALVRGISGNIGPYTLLNTVSRITSIVSVENPLAFSGGTVDETDDELRERYFDAVQAPGKATITMLERALNDISTVAEVKVWNYGSGDMGVLVDHSEGVAEVSKDIVDCLRTNIAAGAVARGEIGATVDAGTVVILEDDVYGGMVWVRPRNFVKLGDYFTFAYRDMANQVLTGSATIPPATHRGAMIQAALQSPSDRAKKILQVTPSSGGNGYDILLGMGEPQYLYNLPELITVNINAQIYLTETPEADLVENIKASLTAFLGAFRIGESLQYSDVLRFFQNYYDATADENVGRTLAGIDEIVQLTALGGGQSAYRIGDRINVEEDWRIEAGTMNITVLEG